MYGSMCSAGFTQRSGLRGPDSATRPWLGARCIAHTVTMLTPLQVYAINTSTVGFDSSLGATNGPRRMGMHCNSCGSVNQRKFTGEIAIHFPGLEEIDEPFVWVFSELVVCADCGIAEFAVPQAELRSLTKGDAAT